MSANSGPLGGPKDPADAVKGATELGLPAGEWVPVFERAGILTDKLGSGHLEVQGNHGWPVPFEDG